MPRTQLSRTPLSRQAGILRTSLLLSLGLSPLACGGTRVVSGNNGGGGSAQHYGGASGFLGTGNEAGIDGTYSGGAPQGGTVGGGADSCPDPAYEPITKLTRCSNGRLHRPTSPTCTFTNGGGAPGIGGAGIGTGGTGFPTICESDADCSALPQGPGVCMCDGIYPGYCIGAGCVTDADCGPNSLCVLTVSTVCGASTFECTSPQDECIVGAACHGTCIMKNGHRVCESSVCGRPFLISEAPRTAAIAARADWLDATLALDPSDLTPIERAQLAAHWARLGQMEHASIAAFARFNLQLLSLGAPSELVEACNRALMDETAHARSCFALASAYGGSALGPARLDIEHCFEDTSLAAVAKLVLREGCLGETVASLEAVAAAEVASDPAVQQALTRIARDELTHAELAFRFLRWALSTASPEVRHELSCEAKQQLADFENNAGSVERTQTDDRLAAHGLLGSDALRTIHLAAVRDVSRPLLAALFDLEESSSPVSAQPSDTLAAR